MNHLEEFTKMTPNHIVKWVLKERQQEVGFAAERDRQVDVANRIRLHARQDAIEGEEGFPQAGSWDSHGF